MPFYDIYKYNDSNQSLMEKLCKKFNLGSPHTRINMYGDLDIIISCRLSKYLIRIEDNYVSLKKENVRRLAQKHQKFYFTEIKRFYDGNIYYDICKFIANDSKI